jgi:hypothetical protein
MNNVIYKQSPSFWQEGAKQPTLGKEPVSTLETVYYQDREATDLDVEWDAVQAILYSLRNEPETDLMWWEVTQDDKACSEHSYWSWGGFAFEFDTIISLDIQDNYNLALPYMPEILTTAHSPLVKSLPVIITKDVNYKLNY